jgi:hypothetical protein
MHFHQAPHFKIMCFLNSMSQLPQLCVLIPSCGTLPKSGRLSSLMMLSCLPRSSLTYYRPALEIDLVASMFARSALESSRSKWLIAMWQQSYCSKEPFTSNLLSLLRFPLFRVCSRSTNPLIRTWNLISANLSSPSMT